MSAETIGKETLLGQLRDSGFTAVVVNRIGELLDAYVRGGGTLQQFCGGLEKGRLWKLYAELRPEGDRGMGDKTWVAYKRFCAIWREAQSDAKETAKAVVEEQERREAEKARLREELLDRVVDFDTLTSAMAALGTLGIRECALGKLLEMYEMAKAAKGGGQ